MSSFISDYNYSNLSFSGCDMVATINMVLPNGTSISRVIGSLQTLTYSIHMDKHPVRSLGNANAKDYVFGPRTIAGTLIFAVFHKHFAYEILDTLKDSAGVQNYHLLTDELPPFDITISFANEYGVTARLALYGVRIINEGQTMSINDIYTENTYQFVATDIEYLNSATGESVSRMKKAAENAAKEGRRSVTDMDPIPSSGAKRRSYGYGVTTVGNQLVIRKE